MFMCEGYVEVTAERQTGSWWVGWLRLNSVSHGASCPLRQGVPGAGVGEGPAGEGESNFCNQTLLLFSRSVMSYSL